MHAASLAHILGLGFPVVFFSLSHMQTDGSGRLEKKELAGLVKELVGSAYHLFFM